MPNWAYSSYCIVGDKEQLKQLYDIMDELEDMESPGLHDNGFGSRWLGNLVIKLGGDWKKVYCRGEWSNLCLYKDRLTFETETAWSELREVRQLLKTKFPKLNFYYQCEELCMGIYITNDKRHKFFKDRYYVYVENEDSEYYSKLKDLCAYVERITGKAVKTFKQCEAVLKEYCGEDLIFELEMIKVVND